MIKYTSIFIIVLFLTGCLPFTKTETLVKYTPIVCPVPTKADALVLREVAPIAVEDTIGLWWVGITPKHYGNLSMNLQDVLAHIKQKNAIIDYYKKCVDDSKEIKPLDENEGEQNEEING